MMIQTQRLEYHDHEEEIACLNAILADIPLPHPPEMKPAVDRLLARLDLLMTADRAVLKLYDPREVHL